MNLSQQNFLRSDTWNPVGVSYNAIRNPQMAIASRGTSVNVAASSNAYTLDGWTQNNSINGITQTLSTSVNLPADTSSNRWYPKSPFAQRIAFGTAQASLTAGQYSCSIQNVEGYLAEPLIGVPTSISFLAYSNTLKTFSVALRDSTFGYSIVYDCTFTAINTWQRFAIPNIPAFPSAGAFLPIDNTLCYQLVFGLAFGSTYQTTTPGIWVNSNKLKTANTSNWADSTSNVFYFTLVQHEPNPFCTPFVQRNRVAEELLNYRYRTPDINCGIGWCWNPNNDPHWTYSMSQIKYPEMRAGPTAGNAVMTNSASTATILTIENQTVHMCNVYDTSNSGVGDMPAGGWAKINGGSFTAEL